MHKRLGVTDYVSTFCSSVVHAQRMHCVGGTRMLLFAEPNKTCILGSTFLMTGTSAGTYPTLWLLQIAAVEGLCTSTLPQGEPSSETYMCGTFTCELKSLWVRQLLKMAVSNELRTIGRYSFGSIALYSARIIPKDMQREENVRESSQ